MQAQVYERHDALYLVLEYPAYDRAYDSERSGRLAVFLYPEDEHEAYDPEAQGRKDRYLAPCYALLLLGQAEDA